MDRLHIENWKEAFEHIRDNLGPGTHEFDVTFDSIKHFKDAAWRYSEVAGEWLIKAVQVSRDNVPANRVKIIVAEHEWRPLQGRLHQDRSAERDKIDALEPGGSVFIEGDAGAVQYVRNYVSGQPTGEWRVRKTPGGCTVERAAEGKTFLSRRQEILNNCKAVAEGFTDCIDITEAAQELTYIRSIAYQSPYPVSVTPRPDGVIQITRKEDAAGTARGAAVEACREAVKAGVVYMGGDTAGVPYTRKIVSEYNMANDTDLSVEKAPSGVFITDNTFIAAVKACAIEKKLNGVVSANARDHAKAVFQSILNHFKTEQL